MFKKTSLGFLILGLTILFIGAGVFVQKTLAQTTSGDAIAIRIIPNPHLYSIADWYASMGYAGSPQDTKVDGYDAIRDNRTVYVAAANVPNQIYYHCQKDPSIICAGDSQCPSTRGNCVNTGSTYFGKCDNDQSVKCYCAGKLCSATIDCIKDSPCVRSSWVGNTAYSNIYIITYNEGADTETSDIFGKILNAWRFNNNLVDANGLPEFGTCSFPTTICNVDSDCPNSNYTCAINSNPLTTNKCVNNTNCLSDDDCADFGSLCNNRKSGLIRDLKRLDSIFTLQKSLATYKSNHGYYPMLSAGTFVPNASISVWPSWEQNFLSDLNSPGISDPINRLGVCAYNSGLPIATTSWSGFDPITCWNGDDHRFYSSSSPTAAASASNLELPFNSYAMAYMTDSKGSSYHLCSNMETQFSFYDSEGGNLVPLPKYDCATSQVTAELSSSNQAPVFVSIPTLKLEAGTPLSFFVRAADPEGNPIIFSMTCSGDSACANVKFAPTVADPNQLHVYTDSGVNLLAGQNYSFVIKATDAYGATKSTTINTLVPDTKITINAGDVDYDLSSLATYSLNYSLYFEAPSFTIHNLTATLKLLSSPDSDTNQLYPCAGKADGASLAVCAYYTNYNQVTYNWKNAALPLSVLINKSSLNATSSINNNLSVVLSDIGQGSVGDNRNYRLNIFGNPYKTSLANLDLNYNLKVATQGPNASDKDFTIHLKPNPPQLTLNCPKTYYSSSDYNCSLNNVNVKNANTTFDFKIYDAVSGNDVTADNNNLKITKTSGNSATLSGTLNSDGNYKIKIIATDDFTASTSAEYDLKADKSGCGDPLQFSGGPFNATGDVRDQGGYYRTIKIGNKCWFADNLAATTTASGPGAPLSMCPGGQPYTSASFKDNCDAYGRLYSPSLFMTLDAGHISLASSNNSLCPTGWHIAKENDFLDAQNAAGGSSKAGERLSVRGDIGLDLDYAGYFKVIGYSSQYLGTTGFYASMSSTAAFYLPGFQINNNTDDAGLYQINLVSTDHFSVISSNYKNIDYYSLRCVKDLACGGTCPSGQYCDLSLGKCQNNCGNGIKDAGEVCDSGSHYNGNIANYNFYRFCNSTCNGYSTNTYCGDGTVNGGEKCDGTAGVALSPADSSANKPYKCSSDCTFDASSGYCGDNKVETQEECDFGVNSASDSAHPACQNCKWKDIAISGMIQDARDSSKGISGIKVALSYDGGVTEAVSTITKSDGTYSFSGINAEKNIIVDINKNGVSSISYGGTQASVYLYNNATNENFQLIPSMYSGHAVLVTSWTNLGDLDPHLIATKNGICSNIGYTTPTFSCSNQAYKTTGSISAVDVGDHDQDGQNANDYETHSVFPNTGATYKFLIYDWAKVGFSDSTISDPGHPSNVKVTLYKPVDSNDFVVANYWTSNACSASGGKCVQSADCPTGESCVARPGAKRTEASGVEKYWLLFNNFSLNGTTISYTNLDTFVNAVPSGF